MFASRMQAWKQPDPLFGSTGAVMPFQCATDEISQSDETLAAASRRYVAWPVSIRAVQLRPLWESGGWLAQWPPCPPPSPLSCPSA
jgi:hypothetical protein